MSIYTPWNWILQDFRNCEHVVYSCMVTPWITPDPSTSSHAWPFRSHRSPCDFTQGRYTVSFRLIPSVVPALHLPVCFHSLLRSREWDSSEIRTVMPQADFPLRRLCCPPRHMGTVRPPDSIQGFGIHFACTYRFPYFTNANLRALYTWERSGMVSHVTLLWLSLYAIAETPWEYPRYVH